MVRPFPPLWRIRHPCSVATRAKLLFVGASMRVNSLQREWFVHGRHLFVLIMPSVILPGWMAAVRGARKTFCVARQQQDVANLEGRSGCGARRRRIQNR